MENNEDMRSLMEQLFPTLYYRLAPDSIEIVKPAPFVPSESVTTEFFEKLKNVLFEKRLVILKRWKRYFEISCLNALSSYVMYVRYVMFACEVEIGFYDDIFQSILSTCAIVFTFITETIRDTDLNLCDLSAEIFMIFYEKNLDEPFNWYGGFKQFAVYLNETNIHGENYFNEGSNIPFTYRAFYEKNANNKIEEEFEKSHLNPDYIKHEDVMRNTDCHVLATVCLYVIESKLILPPLPDITELKKTIKANRQRRSTDSKLRTAVTDSKLEKTWTNSKGEEYFLTSNLKLCPVPNVTIGDSNRGTTTNLKSEAAETVNSSKRKSAIPKKNFKPYERYSKRKEAASVSKCEEILSASKSRGETFDSKGVAKASDPKAVSKAIEPKSMLKVIEPKAVPKAIEPKPFAKTIAPETIAKTIDPKAVAKTIDPKAVAKTIDPKAVANTIDPKASVKKIDPKAAAKTTDSNVLVKTLSSNSQTRPFEKQKFNIAWCENIVQQVLKCNISNCSYSTETNKLIHKEADKTSKRLKFIIKNLIEILDNYDEE